MVSNLTSLAYPRLSLSRLASCEVSLESESLGENAAVYEKLAVALKYSSEIETHFIFGDKKKNDPYYTFGILVCSWIGPSIDFRTMLPFVAFVCVLLISFSDAEQQKPSSFLSNYSSYKNICHKIGWEPNCRTEAEKGCSGKVVAFHALLSTRLTNVPIKTIIKFGQVLVNEGSGYSPTTGKFTAPLDGVYSFSWTYCTPKGSNAYLGGYVDGKLITKISNYEQASGWKNTSGHLVIKLKKGNQFWVQAFHSTAQLIHEEYTFLSGYKLSGC
uniref:Complement C1q tumor necrosis factor-related protein 3 n=1 Tax=Magallana gigas TaxID=29159 RepID=K1QKY2_MAGGI